MPEFRVENFDEGLERSGAHLGEVRKQAGSTCAGKFEQPPPPSVASPTSRRSKHRQLIHPSVSDGTGR